jgi:outer membrane protein
MKSINPVLNIVLLIAVIILYVLHFTGSKSATEEIATEEAGGIYYINIDTLNTQLTFLTEKQAILEQKEIDFENKFKEKATALERDITSYQREAQGGYMTPKQMQTKEAQLGRRQQELLAERDSIASALMMESQAINEQLMKKLKKYIDEFNVNNKTQFVFAYSEASNILHADKSKDITADILKKMNADQD